MSTEDKASTIPEGYYAIELCQDLLNPDGVTVYERAGIKTLHRLPVHHSHFFVCGKMESGGVIYPSFCRVTMPDGRTLQDNEWHSP